MSVGKTEDLAVHLGRLNCIWNIVNRVDLSLETPVFTYDNRQDSSAASQIHTVLIFAVDILILLNVVRK